MALNLFYFLVSFAGDALAYIFYQEFLDSKKTNTAAVLAAIVSAFFVWLFIFKLQARGAETLRVFIPVWAAGSAVFGYFAGGLATHTSLRDLFNPTAVISVLAISLGIFFLNRP